MRPLPLRPPPADVPPAGPSGTTPAPSSLGAMDDASLLALFLGRGRSGPAADRLAGALLDRFGCLGDAAAASAAELGRIEGLAPAAILDLKLMRELAVRMARAAACARPALSSWSAVVDYARVSLAHLPREQFRTLYLDRRNILIRDEFLAEDPTVQAAVDRRIERLLDATAARIVAGRTAAENVAGEPRSFDPPR